MYKDPIGSLGLADRKCKQFAAKGILTVEDLLRFFPRKYTDYSNLCALRPAMDGECIEGAFVVNITSIGESPYGAKIPYVKIGARDAISGGWVTIFWFRQRLNYGTFRGVLPGARYFVTGKATYSAQYGSYTITAPSTFLPYTADCLGIYPTYSKIQGMSDQFLQESIATALFMTESDEGPYPEEIAGRNGLPRLHAAYKELHHPTAKDALDSANRRIIFDELFKFSLQLQYAQKMLSKGSQYNLRSLSLVQKAQKALPFTLTLDQSGVLDGIFENMREGRRVHALVCGDVGCGKTQVAILSMLAMVGSGFQCALMAPSKVLAQQHYNDLVKQVEPLGVKVGLCIGLSSMKASERKEFLSGVSDGTIQIAVGTQALLSSKVKFHDLALCITDEEHKFGVAQRAALVDKASAGVHSITMSATPIPRSLAQVVYGDDVQLYTITTMPNGRIPVRTAITSRIDAALHSVERQLSIGHQVFVVCPAIATTEKNDKASVEEVANVYSDYFTPRGYRIATLTGKDSKATMEETICDFANGSVHILISTTVIEVGVNIPNATMIVIHSADLFGLSSLHQLRGRVGRASFPSYCVLLSSKKDNERLKIMVETTNGYDIAMADLKMRGAGDWVGTDQAGSYLPVQLMLAYPQLYEAAKVEATAALRNSEEWEIVRQAIGEEEEE